MRKKIGKVWLDDHIFLYTDRNIFRQLDMLTKKVNELVDIVNEGLEDVEEEKEKMKTKWESLRYYMSIARKRFW